MYREASTTSAPPPQLSAVEKIVRYAEKDDMLLYVTATAGVILPGLMYALYKYVHTKYHAYAKRKKATEKLKKQQQRRITLYYAEGEKKAKRTAYKLAESLEKFDPLVVNLTHLKVNEFVKEGISVFIADTTEETPSTSSHGYAQFCEWLQEMRFEMRKKSLLHAVHFTVIEIAKESDSSKPPSQMESLRKALVTLGAHPIDHLMAYFCADEVSITESEEWSKHFRCWLRDSMKVNDSDTDMTCTSEEDESERSSGSEDDEYTFVSKKRQ
jgi:hypothetical protein